MDIIPTPLNAIKRYPSYGETRRGLYRFGTRAGKRDIRLGFQNVNVFPGDDIQAAIDRVYDQGNSGGIVFFKIGDFYPARIRPAHIKLYPNVYLQGQSAEGVTLD